MSIHIAAIKIIISNLKIKSKFKWLSFIAPVDILTLDCFSVHMHTAWIKAHSAEQIFLLCEQLLHIWAHKLAGLSWPKMKEMKNLNMRSLYASQPVASASYNKCIFSLLLYSLLLWLIFDYLKVGVFGSNLLNLKSVI